jgi:hypothetical protein
MHSPSSPGAVVTVSVMAHTFKRLPPWWDREFDASGTPIRDDVRVAAISVWEKVCKVVQQDLGDLTDAAQLFERSVDRVSVYLNKRKVAPHDPSGLLILDVYRSARRLAQQRNRVLLVGGTSELSRLLGAPDWTHAAERQIFLDRLISLLSPDVGGLLRFRMEGFEWDEIAEMLNCDSSSIRKRFWRAIRRAHLQLLSQTERYRM